MKEATDRIGRVVALPGANSGGSGIILSDDEKTPLVVRFGQTPGYDEVLALNSSEFEIFEPSRSYPPGTRGCHLGLSTLHPLACVVTEYVGGRAVLRLYFPDKDPIVLRGVYPMDFRNMSICPDRVGTHPRVGDIVVFEHGQLPTPGIITQVEDFALETSVVRVSSFRSDKCHKVAIVEPQGFRWRGVLA